MATSERRRHDPSYRKIFAHPWIMRQLLERFIEPGLTQSLDLDRMEAVSTSFVAESLARRDGDLLWKIPIIGQDVPLFVFVWLELQSWSDATMAVRMGTYIMLFYEQLLAQKPDYIDQGLPTVLPIVLYNGSGRWTAPVELSALYAPDPSPARVSYRYQGRYDVIKVHEYTKDQLEQINTSLATLFMVEQADEDELTDLLDLLISQLDADTLRDTQRAITAWLTEALRIKGATFPNRSIDSLLEFRTMLEENIDRWLQQRHEQGHQEGLNEGLQKGLDEGIQKGIQKGLQRGRDEGVLLATRNHLSKLMAIKFGPREGRDAELEARPLEVLELALERILSADSEAQLWD